MYIPQSQPQSQSSMSETLMITHLYFSFNPPIFLEVSELFELRTVFGFLMKVGVVFRSLQTKTNPYLQINFSFPFPPYIVICHQKISEALSQKRRRNAYLQSPYVVTIKEDIGPGETVAWVQVVTLEIIMRIITMMVIVMAIVYGDAMIYFRV